MISMVYFLIANSMFADVNDLDMEVSLQDYFSNNESGLYFFSDSEYLNILQQKSRIFFIISVADSTGIVIEFDGVIKNKFLVFYD